MKSEEIVFYGLVGYHRKHIMEPLITKRIFCFTHDERNIIGTKSAGLPLSCNPGHEITTYEELLEKISALNFYNPALKLFFRGQVKDHFSYTPDNKPIRSSLYPSILRKLPTINKSKRSKIIKKRIYILKCADDLLKKRLSIGYLHKHLLVRWAILQHYEVCDTPLLDITDQLNVALTFAIKSYSQDGFIYVFGFPHQSGPISVSVESMTQLIDLTKICPPEVLRPHFQSAFLAVDYPTAIYPDDLIYRAPKIEANFACRLLTKFHLKNVNKWIGTKYHPIPQEIIFPNNRDKWYPILDDIKNEIAQQCT